MGGSFFGPLFFSSAVPKQEKRARNWNLRRSGEKINPCANLPICLWEAVGYIFAWLAGRLPFTGGKGWLAGYAWRETWHGSFIWSGRNGFMAQNGGRIWVLLSRLFFCWIWEVHPTISDIGSNIVALIKNDPSRTTCQKIIIPGYPSWKDERFKIFLDYFSKPIRMGKAVYPSSLGGEGASENLAFGSQFNSQLPFESSRSRDDARWRSICQNMEKRRGGFANCCCKKMQPAASYILLHSLGKVS